MDTLYHDDFLAELAHLKNVGLLTDYDLKCGENNASCGDDVMLTLQFDPDQDNQIIQAVGWQGAGCSISQVSCSLVTEAMKGKPLAAVKKWTLADIEKLLGLESVSVGRVKCLLLPIAALNRPVEK